MICVRFLANDVAVKAYQEGKLPFPDGAIITRLACRYVPSEENNEVFGRPQSFTLGGRVYTKHKCSSRKRDRQIRGRLSLKELRRLAGGIPHNAVGIPICRFTQCLQSDRSLLEKVSLIQKELQPR
jgi:hypothetical protein